jgi:hypothetical protein
MVMGLILAEPRTMRGLPTHGDDICIFHFGIISTRVFQLREGEAPLLTPDVSNLSPHAAIATFVRTLFLC